MPRFQVASLQRIGCQLFEAAGCMPEDARAVVEHLVESNLFGHDSHGAIRFLEYAKGIREGLYQAQAKPRIVNDRPCMALVDGNGALGPIGATFATKLAMDKARSQGVGVVSLRNTCHIVRVGAYPLIAAREGFLSQIFVNAGHHGVFVAPFGGIDGKLSSNPLAFAAPRRDADPILLDMTTSVAAIGKVWVAANRGDRIPDGWLIDADGNPSTDPNELLPERRGAMLPMGAPVAYKGYGLSLMIELLGGALSGQGCAAGEWDVVSNGVLITVFDIDQFAGRSSYFDDVEALIQHVKSSRLADGFEQIQLPGEFEFANARAKQVERIDIDATTWEKIRDQARQLGLDTNGWVDD